MQEAFVSVCRTHKKFGRLSFGDEALKKNLGTSHLSMKDKAKIWETCLWRGSPETKLGDLSSRHEGQSKSLGDLPLETKP